MLIGKVVGTLVATRKVETMEDLKFPAVKQVDTRGTSCECRLCEAYACPLGLPPMAYYKEIKR